MVQWFGRLLPGAIIGVFGFAVVVWLGRQSLRPVLLIPLIVGIIGVAYTILPDHRFADAGLVIAYVLGGVVASFLLFGIVMGPVGGDPRAVAAFIEVAVPLVTLYVLGVFVTVGRVVWTRLETQPTESG